MCSGGGGGGTTTVQNADPWSGVQPYLKGTSETSRRLKTGVSPIYGGGNALGYNDWLAQNPRDSETGKYPFRGTPESAYLQYQSTNPVRSLLNPESDYETITTGTPGIYPETARVYGDNLKTGYIGQTQGQKDATASAQSWLNYALGGDLYKNAWNTAGEIGTGSYDPRLGSIRGVSAGDVSAQSARAGQGPLDPTTALQRILSGQVDTTGLDALQQAASNRAMVGYGDAVTDAGRMFSEQIAPSIRSGAQLSGQYGGSRQGIAEGVASRGIADQLSRNARDLGLGSMDLGNALYSNAYNTAKNQQYGTANTLNQQATDIMTGNVNRDLSAQQFNSGLDVTRNAQEMQRAAQAVANAQAGLGMANTTALGYGGLQDASYGLAGRERADLLGAQQYPWDQLKNYASIVSPGAGIGGTSTSTQSGGESSPVTGLIGGALAGNALAGLIPGMGAGGVGAGLGAVGGGLLGLLSDRRLKTDIEPVGKMDNGLTVYRYRYKSGGPMMLGVMADEVKEVNPAAVGTHESGFDYVNYEEL